MILDNTQLVIINSSPGGRPLLSHVCFDQGIVVFICLKECLKKSGMAVLEWLVRLLNLSFDMGVVPMDWRGACVVPCTKGRVTNVNVAT